MLALCLAALALSGNSAEAAAVLENGGFEGVAETHPGPDGLVQGWRLARPGLVPAAWQLNAAYPGKLAVYRPGPGRPPAHGGERFVRMGAGPDRPAHLYQVCQHLESGKWYRVSAWVRDGAAALSFYEYYKSGKMSGQEVVSTTDAGGGWKRIEGFYRPPGGDFLQSALAVSVPAGRRADIDDVAVETLDLPPIPADAPELAWETDLWRLAITPQGAVRHLVSKPTGRDYAAGMTPLAALRAFRGGVPIPVHSLTRNGELVVARFSDPDVRAVIRVTPGPRHLALEVVDVQPADVESLAFQLPVVRLKKLGPAFNATYDDQFGVCLLAATANVKQEMLPYGGEVLGLGARVDRRKGQPPFRGDNGRFQGDAALAAKTGTVPAGAYPGSLAGSRLLLVAGPANQFGPAIREAEKAAGLPCPMLEGLWARDSRAVRRSYLFVVDASEANVERTIEYAQAGHFRMIVMLKDNWLATHGHYQINTAGFPGGRASVKRWVDRIHAAGLQAGVHVFGPSISPNDPYVTPRPDARLAGVACPPLAEGVDAKATELLLSRPARLPPAAPHSEAFPGQFLLVGDEIIQYQDVGPAGPASPPGATGSASAAGGTRVRGCLRGALGTRAAGHPAGTAVKQLLALWSFFLADPDSTLADELTGNFASVFNECDFDMVYFDASDGIDEPYLDRRYYLNKLHLGYYRKFKKDVIYQTSNGTGTDLVWHIVPRGASADGHGDLKRYLDERLDGMLAMEADWTRPDVGWYYMYRDVRPDQIEYVSAKTLGLDGSFSIETSLAAMDQHPRARQMMEMLGRYEDCRQAGCFSPSVLALLRQPGRDFKLFRQAAGGTCASEGATGVSPAGWKLYRAWYEQPRYVEAIDGRQNVWTLRNDRAEPAPLGVEIVCGSRNLATADYRQPHAWTLEDFEDPEPYRRVPGNPLASYGDPRATLADSSIGREGVRSKFSLSEQTAPAGRPCGVLQALNQGYYGGWCAAARRFPRRLNLSRAAAFALWVEGDAGDETLLVQLRDSAGRATNWSLPVGFKGWRLCAFRKEPALDWSKIDALWFFLQALPVGRPLAVRLAGLRALPAAPAAPPLVEPAVELNGQAVRFPVSLHGGQALSGEGPGGVQLWPGGMRPPRPVDVPSSPLVLQPGENRILFSAGGGGDYPGDVCVLLYRLEPL
jgi:hypothetical protein